MLTMTLPVVAPGGTIAVICVVLQLVIVADTPLNVTIRPPCEILKSDPLIVTKVPTGPDVGLKEEMLEVPANEMAGMARHRTNKSAENRRMLRMVPPERPTPRIS